MKEIICSCCGKLKKADDYYASQSYFMKATGKVHTCKQCIWDYVIPLDKINYDMLKVKEALRAMDRPFISDLWDSAVIESNNRDKTKPDIFKLYMKNLGMKDFRDLNWNDSSEILEARSQIEESVIADNLQEDNLTTEEINYLKKLWGNSFTIEDLLFLQEFYGEYENNFPTDTPAQVNIYKNLAKIHLQAEKELDKGNVKAYKDLMDLSSKMHTDGNIKPIQSSGMNDDKGVSTYGLWIKTIEYDEPCEYFKDKPNYEDYDGFKKYIDKWFVRPMKNIFNISKDFNVEDDKK